MKTMGLMLILKKACLLLLLISASFLSTSFAGGRSTSVSNMKNEVGATQEKQLHQEKKVETNDYGRYDPAPTFGKPPFKLIPN
ncbi:hypothetical protein LguiA_027542 [Lonicera macranthoides]